MHTHKRTVLDQGFQHGVRVGRVPRRRARRGRHCGCPAGEGEFCAEGCAHTHTHTHTHATRGRQEARARWPTDARANCERVVKNRRPDPLTLRARLAPFSSSSSRIPLSQMRALAPAPRQPTCPARRGRPPPTTPRAGQTPRAAPPPSPAVALAADTAPVTSKDTRSSLPPPPELDQLPPSLARSVAVVRRGGVPVYLLGVSHVSAVSVEQVR